MSEFVTFDARVEPMEWGKATYTVVRVPEDVVTALGQTKRVEGEFNDHPVNLALTKAPVIEGVFVWAGKAFLKDVGLAPGETFEARLRPVSDAHVEVDTDVMAAITARHARTAWDALTPGKQRGLLYQIKSAKRAETRAKRIAVLIAQLKGLG